MIIVSACLAGINCNYKGQSKPCEKVIELIKEGKAIPVCPETLGGLSIPRAPAKQKGNKVFTNHGKDVTANFIRGAEEGLRIAKLADCKIAILKARSPSCDSDKGVFARLLKRNGIKVFSEEDLEDEKLYQKEIIEKKD